MNQDENMKDSRYDQALERAKELHEAGNSLTKAQMEIVFPELNESEDEGIREALVNLIVADINELIKSADSRAYFQGVKEYLEDVRQFAYNKGIVDAMEKQKDKVVKFDHDRELKPAEWSEEDEEMFERFLGWLQGTMGEKTYSSWLKSLRERFSLEPKQEWSEKDKKMLRDVYESLYAYQCDIRGEENPDPELLDQVKKEKQWVKSLPERFNLQSKQEWNEESEKNLNEIIHFFESLCSCLATEERHAENKRWLKFLKSLRSQPKEERKPMEIKYGGKIYKVHGVRATPGGVTGYIIEDEPGHYDCIMNPEEVLGGGYGVKQNGSPYPTNEATFGYPKWMPSEEELLQLRCVISGCSYDIGPLVSLEKKLQQLRYENRI